MKLTMTGGSVQVGESPCASCEWRPSCNDDWVGCKKWNQFIRKAWRKVTHLFSAEPNQTPDFKYWALYVNGKNDCEIAEVVGVTQPAVFQWRRRNHLPPRGKRGRPAKRQEEILDRTEGISC